MLIFNNYFWSKTQETHILFLPVCKQRQMHTLIWFTTLLRTTVSFLLLTNRLLKQLSRWRQEKTVYISSLPKGTHFRDGTWAVSGVFLYRLESEQFSPACTLKRLHLSQGTTSRKHIAKCLDSRAQGQEWAVCIPGSRLLAKILIKYKFVKDDNVQFR